MSGHLDLDPRVRQQLLAARAATLDRLLQPIKTPVGRGLGRRRQQSPGRNISVRTFRPAVALRVKGIDSDIYSTFISSTLARYSAEQGMGFIGSRPHNENGQTLVEQKNCAVARQFVGHDRHSGLVVRQTMSHRYGAVPRVKRYRAGVTQHFLADPAATFNGSQRLQYDPARRIGVPSIVMQPSYQSRYEDPWIPVLSTFGHGIEYDQKLSRGCGDRNLLGFAGLQPDDVQTQFA